MLNELQLNELLAELKIKMYGQGVSVYKILYDLKHQDITPVTATRLVHELTDKSLAEAKSYVAHHPAWEKEYYNSKLARKEIEHNIEEFLN